MVEGFYSIHWNHVSMSRFAKSELMVDNSPVASIVSDVFPSGGFLTDDASTSGTFLLESSNELSIFTNETIQPHSFLTGYLIKEYNNSAFYATTNGVVVSDSVFPRYENVLLNTSSDFRVDHFVASRDGFYVFSVMSASFDGLFDSDLIINNKRVEVSAGEFVSSDSNPFVSMSLRTLSSGAKTCVVKLNETDAVGVRVREAFSPFVNGIRDDIPWIFTGFRYLDADEVNLTAVFVTNRNQLQVPMNVPINALAGGVVHLDNTNNFSPTTGLFTARTEGLYVISVAVFSSFRSRYEVLVSNNSVTSGLNDGYDNTTNVTQWFNGSGRVLVLFLNSGDTVQVNMTEGVISDVEFLFPELSIWALH